VGETPPGAPFAGFGDLNSPDTFTIVQMATCESFPSPCGEDLSDRLQSIMLRPGYKQSVPLSIIYTIIFILTFLSSACDCWMLKTCLEDMLCETISFQHGPAIRPGVSVCWSTQMLC
jgi:hypothetical protein